MRLLFFRQRATLPSKASKKKPKGRNTSASHTLPRDAGSPRQ